MAKDHEGTQLAADLDIHPVAIPALGDPISLDKLPELIEGAGHPESPVETAEVLVDDLLVSHDAWDQRTFQATDATTRYRFREVRDDIPMKFREEIELILIQESSDRKVFFEIPHGLFSLVRSNWALE